MSNSRWVRASREDLEALIDAINVYDVRDRPFIEWDPRIEAPLRRLQHSCPPLRTEAEVAAEALVLWRRYHSATPGEVGQILSESRALAKEPTR